MEDLTDISLATKCKKGERQYQKLLYELYAKKLYVICISYAKDKPEAKDFLQVGFMKIYRNIGKYNGKGPLIAWLKRIVRNNILDELRKKKIIISDSDYIQNKASETLADTGMEMEKPSIELNEVEKMMELIPQKARAVLNLYALEGMSHKEISQTLGISVGTSKSQLNRARYLLKEFMKN